MRRAWVVAHPDDESIWYTPSPGDYVFACSTPTNDKARVEQFLQACKILGVTGAVWAQQDGGRDKLSKLNPGVFLAGLDKFDTVVTHNSAGEYGHPHHRQIHDWVKTHYRGKVIQFGHGMPASQSRYLTDEEWGRKLAALQCYRTILGPDGENWRYVVKLYFQGELESLRTERWIV